LFAAERTKIIIEILKDKKHINVSDLSNMLNVSEVTIRRDLEKLEKQNLLTRTHGGAILNEIIINNPQEEEPVVDDDCYKKRIEISNIASHMIEDNDVIILSPGRTNLCIAKKILPRRNITVLTNDITIAQTLTLAPNIKVILPGGDLDPSYMALSGRLTEENIRKFFVTKSFIEVDGVTIERGYTVQNIELAAILKEMTKISHETIMVCPDTSFSKNAFSHVAEIKMADKIITNPGIPDSYKNYFFENNIQLFTTFNSFEGNIL